jgi:hypothetical protein
LWPKRQNDGSRPSAFHPKIHVLNSEISSKVTNLFNNANELVTTWGLRLPPHVLYVYSTHCWRSWGLVFSMWKVPLTSSGSGERKTASSTILMAQQWNIIVTNQVFSRDGTSSLNGH